MRCVPRTFLVLALVAASAATVAASKPVFWQTATLNDFLRGEVENLSIDGHGRLVLGPATELVAETTSPFLWAMVVAPDGSIYVGSGNEGKVFKIGAGGKVETFFDSTELRRNEHRRVSDLLRGIPGLTVVRFQECEWTPRKTCGQLQERAASGRGEITMHRGALDRDTYCWMSIVLDGSYLFRAGTSGSPPDLSRDLRIADFESVEVYRSASEVPSEFNSTSAACGVIVLWSRRN